MEDIEKIAKVALEDQERRAARDPNILTAMGIVSDFIKDNRVMCYGGTAINNLLPKEDQFYNPNKDIPDYDFFSETPQVHALKLADKLTNAGFKSVEVKPGIHLGTFKVFSDYTGVADISHLNKTIFMKLWKESIERGGIHYVPPNFLRMSVYLELSRPKGDVTRWKKVYSRLLLLNKHFPMECPKEQSDVSSTYLKPEIKKNIEKLLVKEKIILLGFNASNLQRRRHTDWILPMDILVTPDKRDKVSETLLKYLEEKTEQKLKIEQIPAYEELLPAHTDIDDPKTGKTLIRIYETNACHSFHETSSGLMIASIPTLLQFFLATLYSPKHFLEEVPEQRFLCTADHLVAMANNDLPRRYKLLTPITCLGTQKSLLDMRKDKSVLYEKLSKNKSSPEFLEYFFTYVPTSMDTTRRRKVRDDLKKTLRK